MDLWFTLVLLGVITVITSKAQLQIALALELQSLVAVVNYSTLFICKKFKTLKKCRLELVGTHLVHYPECCIHALLVVRYVIFTQFTTSNIGSHKCSLSKQYDSYHKKKLQFQHYIVDWQSDK